MGSDSLDAFLALNDNFSGSSYTFADSMAARQAGLNPMGLPISAGNGAGDNPAYAFDYRNGSDIASDTYDGSRRTATVRNGQGPLAALADLGLNSAQQQAGYGYLLKTGQVQLGRNGVPIVQAGQQLHIDLDDMSQAGLAGRAIAQESSMRADRAATAAQVATAVNAGAYPNMDARDLRNNFGYQSMMARGLSDLGSMPSANYAEARASTLSARETAVDWVRSVVGTDRAGNVIAGAANGWLAGGEAVLKLPDAIAAIPSAVSRLASGTASAATQLWNDPVGSVTNAMASGVDGFRTGFNQTVNGNGFAMGSALYAIGTAGLPLGRAEGVIGTAGELDMFRRVSNQGAFADLPVLMDLRTVRSYADEAGVGLDGVKVRIVRDESLLGSGFGGYTHPNGKSIDLYPDAFSSPEELVRTLGHERMHVYQARTFGAPQGALDLRLNENAAYGLENSFVQYWRLNGGR